MATCNGRYVSHAGNLQRSIVLLLRSVTYKAMTKIKSPELILVVKLKKYAYAPAAGGMPRSRFFPQP